MKKNQTIKQGSTVSWVVRWEGTDLTFKPITAISKEAPPLVTAVGHGLASGWRVALTNVKGMTALNAQSNPPAPEDFYTVLKITNDTFRLLGVDATGFQTYTSGGVVRYYTPVSLVGFTARMQIRSTIDAATTLLELTTENGRIALDAVANTITLTISALDTAALTFSSAVYSLELVSPIGEVTELLYGNVDLVKEITR